MPKPIGLTFLLLTLAMSFSSCGIKLLPVNHLPESPSKITFPPPDKKTVFFQGGYGGRLLTSSDLVNWTQAPVPTGPYADNNFNLRGGCTDGSTVIFVGGGAPVDADHQWARRDISTDGGTTWTEQLENFNWYGGCAFDATTKVFLSVGGQGLVSTSSDSGKSWQLKPQVLNEAANATLAFREIVCRDGRCVARADSGFAVTFDDGMTWKLASNPNGITNLALGKNGFIGFASDGEFATSADGLVWVTLPLPKPATMAVLFNGTGYLAYGFTDVLQSSDTLAWTDTVLNEQLRAVYHSAGRYVGFGDGTSANTLFTSADGKTWNAVDGYVDLNLKSTNSLVVIQR